MKEVKLYNYHKKVVRINNKTKLKNKQIKTSQAPKTKSKAKKEKVLRF